MSTPKLAATPPETPDPPAPKPAAPTAEAKAETSVPKSAIELRAARRRILQRRFALWVGLPTLLAIIYYTLVATSQYDAMFVVAIESSEGRVSGDAAGKAPNAGNLRDARLLREAMRSAPALAAVDREGAFRSHYRDHGDWVSRLDGDAGPDATLAYFRDKVAATHETGTNISTVRVRAFSGEAAYDFATRLVEYARVWVEKQNETSSAARLKLAQAEVKRERALLATAAQAMAQAGSDAPRTDPAAIDYQVAEKRLEIALKGLQEAQLEVGRAQRYLVVLDGPTRPETAASPRRLWGIASVFVGAVVLISVLSLLGAAVREHAKF